MKYLILQVYRANIHQDLKYDRVISYKTHAALVKQVLEYAGTFFRTPLLSYKESRTGGLKTCVVVPVNDPVSSYSWKMMGFFVSRLDGIADLGEMIRVNGRRI